MNRPALSVHATLLWRAYVPRDTVTYLTLIGEGKKPKHSLYLCVCGNHKEVRPFAVRLFRIKSCGCLSNKMKSKHGMHKTRVYRTWTQMRVRCTNKKHKQYKDYGGRGIRICKRWRESFEAFFADMGHPPAGMSLDRIDNDLGYNPDNCRWATCETQSGNRRSSDIIEFDGRKQCRAKWARELGLSRPALAYRIKKWGVAKALQAVRRNYPRRDSQNATSTSDA